MKIMLYESINISEWRKLELAKVLEAVNEEL